jgi:hypothetical protein
MAELLATKAFDWAVGEVLSAVATKVLSSRINATRLAVADEFARGGISVQDLEARDDLVAAMIALVEALRRGAAIENLRLVARIIAAKANGGNDGQDEVLMWTEMIASLTAEERYFLAVLARYDRAVPSPAPGAFEHEDRVSEAFTEEIQHENPFGNSYERVQSTGLGLLRTGCVKPIVLVSGAYRFVGTSKLRRLAKLDDLVALADEFSPSFRGFA